MGVCPQQNWCNSCATYSFREISDVLPLAMMNRLVNRGRKACSRRLWCSRSQEAAVVYSPGQLFNGM